MGEKARLADRQAFPWGIMIRAIVVIMLGSLLFLVLAPTLRSPFKLPNSDILAESLSSYLTVIGVIYALMVGFTFQQSIERQRDLRQSLHREAGSLRNIILLTEVMQEGEAIPTIVDALSEYIEAINRDMNEAQGHTAALRQLYTMIPRLNELASDDVNDDIDRVTLRAIHEELRETSRSHADRVAIRTNRLPSAQWFSLGFLAFLLLMGFLMLDLGSVGLEAMMFALVLGSVTVLMEVMRDLDEPFDGIWAVNRSAFEDLQDQLFQLKSKDNHGGK